MSVSGLGDFCARSHRKAVADCLHRHSLAAVEAIVAQGLAVTVVKEGTFPRSLRMLGTEDGLPALPTAEIRLHASRTAQPPAILLARHLRDHFKAVHIKAT